METITAHGTIRRGPSVTKRFVDALAAKFEDDRFHIESGTRFDRIVRTAKARTHGSVHAFVERSTGLLVKPAGWKAPAKRSNGELQSKYDLSDPAQFNAAVQAADRFGGYLYAAR